MNGLFTSLQERKTNMKNQTTALILLFLTFFSHTNGNWLQDFHHKTQEKLTNFQVYVQDIISGPNATVIAVAQANSSFTSPTLFGRVFVLDDAVRTGPSASYPILGRAQGFFAFSSLEEGSIHMTFDLVFTNGIYNGSTLNLAGHNNLRDYRELAVVGGTGAFRFGRGFVGVTTVSRNNVTGDSFFLYNITALHY